MIAAREGERPDRWGVDKFIDRFVRVPARRAEKMNHYHWFDSESDAAIFALNRAQDALEDAREEMKKEERHVKRLRLKLRSVADPSHA
jgi:hypothetical protein